MNSAKNKQCGASLVGMLIAGGMLLFLGTVGAQLVPTYSEFQLIGKTVDKINSASSAPEARSNFDKSAQIDGIKSITGKDLVFTQEGSKTVISYAYTQEIHLAGPAYLLMKYAGRSN
jgi:hypothetical protein